MTDDNREWRVWCSVYGGVTGSRGAWLKSNGEVMRFSTEDEARAKASQCYEATKNSTATHSYVAEQF